MVFLEKLKQVDTTISPVQFLDVWKSHIYVALP